MLQRIGSVIWKSKLILAVAIAAGSFWGWRIAQQRSVTLLALDTNTGAVQWFQPLGKDVYSRGAVAAGGTVILESAESSAPEQRSDDIYQLQAFDVQSGNRLWSQQFNAPAGDAAVNGFGYYLASNSVVYLQPTALYLQVGDELRSLNPTTGEQRWAIKRPWFNTGDRASLWMDLGVAATQQQAAVLQLNSRQQQLQILDAATGKVQRQIGVPASDFVTNFDRIRQTNRYVLTLGRDQLKKDASGNGQPILTSYNIDSGKIEFRTPFEGEISNLQAVGKVALLSNGEVYNKQGAIQVDGRIMALDSQTRRVLWQRSDSQLQCPNYRSTWQADAQSVYLNCIPALRGLSRIVALSTQTGQILWETFISPNSSSGEYPIAISTRQLLILHLIQQGDKSQTQVIALDRQTGKRLWIMALFYRPWSFFRSRIATDRDHLFVTDDIPQWQLWLLQMNRHWYLNSAIAVEAVKH